MMQGSLVGRMMYLFAIGAFCSGCASVAREPVEPINFHVMTESELSVDMNAMSERIAGIAIVSLDQTMSDEQRRQRILPLLDGIEEIAQGVKGDDEITNYSVINRYMGSFLYDVANARDFANRQPPNLVPAERLIKSCLSCHESI